MITRELELKWLLGNRITMEYYVKPDDIIDFLCRRGFIRSIGHSRIYLIQREFEVGNPAIDLEKVYTEDYVTNSSELYSDFFYPRRLPTITYS